MMKRWMAFVMVLCLTMSFVPAALAAYTAGEYMQYEVKNGSIDVQGKYKGNFINTTYANNGYKSWVSKELNGADLDFEADFINNGRYVRLSYSVTAGDTEIQDGKFGIFADIQVGANDSAAIETIRDGNRVIGISMIDSTSGAQFSLYFRDAIGVPVNADTHWFGLYSDRIDNVFNALNSVTASEIGYYGADYQSYYGADSGLAVSWQNINLAPGESRTFSIIVGAGAAAKPIEIDPSDPLSINLDSITKGTEFVFASGTANTAMDTLVLYYSLDGQPAMPVQDANADTATDPGKTIVSGKVPTADLEIGTHTLTFYIADTESMAMSASKTITLTVEPAAPASSAPKTGDSTPVLLYFMLMMTSGMLLLIPQRKSKRAAR